MQNGVARAYQAFAAGAIAGFLQSFIIWGVGKIGLFVVLGIPVSFPFQLAWFYQRITWGGLWGFVFLVPMVLPWPQWKRGLLVGVAPALASLFFFLPFKDGQGMLGLELGPMFPIVVIVFDLLWGIIAGALLEQALRPTERAG